MVRYQVFTQVATVLGFTDGLQHILFEVDRSHPEQAVRIPYKKAVDSVVRAILETENVSRTRSLATLLGLRQDAKQISDDRTLIVIQRLGQHRQASPLINFGSRVRSNGPPLERSQQVSTAKQTSPELLSSEIRRPATSAVLQRRRDWKFVTMLALFLLILALQVAEITGSRVTHQIAALGRAELRALIRGLIPALQDFQD